MMITISSTTQTIIIIITLSIILQFIHRPDTYALLDQTLYTDFCSQTLPIYVPLLLGQVSRSYKTKYCHV